MNFDEENYSLTFWSWTDFPQQLRFTEQQYARLAQQVGRATSGDSTTCDSTTAFEAASDAGRLNAAPNKPRAKAPAATDLSNMILTSH
jgi:hypothetical protein